jgi:hypothetical protein
MGAGNKRLSLSLGAGSAYPSRLSREDRRVFLIPKTVGALPYSASFAERVGARFPIWNRLRRPSTFSLTSRLHNR